MGLDAYFYIEDKSTGEDAVEIGYFRKHPNLQGWMERVWRDKGNEGYFNCVSLYLDENTLNNLQYDVENDQLPSTSGFFFGGNSDEYYKDYLLEVIDNCRSELYAGNSVFYSSWW
jgi:hypothetical protein